MPCGTLSCGVGSYQYLALDRFVDSNGTSLPSHTPNLGPAWATDIGSDPALTIQSNQASSTGFQGNAQLLDRASNFSMSVDWIPTAAQLTIANEVILHFRVHGLDFYDASLQGNGRLAIDTDFSSTFTNRASTNIGALTAGSRYTLKASWQGNTVTVTVNGANAITYTDSTHSTDGFQVELVLNRTNDTLVVQNWQITSP